MLTPAPPHSGGPTKTLAKTGKNKKCSKLTYLARKLDENVFEIADPPTQSGSPKNLVGNGKN